MTEGGERTYVPRRVSHTGRVPVRSVDYRIRTWGSSDDPPIVLLHGARDQAVTFQFLVDAFERDRFVVAPDWRGHGGSGWTPGGYWLAEFVRDLDALLDVLLPGAAVPIVGHSMGGNVASLFAAVRPTRVTRLVSLDALGPPPSRSPVDLPAEMIRLLDAERRPAKHRVHPDLGSLASRLRRADPRLDAAHASFLAVATSHQVDGGFVRDGDPGFRSSLPTINDVAGWAGFWTRIVAPALILLAGDDRADSATRNDEEVARRVSHFPDARVRRIPATGHNLHHDAVEAVASVIEAFLDGADDGSILAARSETTVGEGRHK